MAGKFLELRKDDDCKSFTLRRPMPRGSVLVLFFFGLIDMGIYTFSG
jgi:hypothetical protein